MSSSTTRQSRTTTLAAALTGLVLLGALAFFAIGLPHLSGSDHAEAATGSVAPLPDTLPGGWKALEDAKGPDGADQAAYAAQQKAALAYVNKTLATVYTDEPTEFRAYVSPGGDALVTATIFGGSGGAFAPPNGVADAELFGLDRAPVELTREGSAVCIANYQSAAQSGGATAPADDTPLSVSCQVPHDGSTVMIGSQSMTVAATAALLKSLTAELA